MSRKHTVKQGECLSSIASHYGFGDWRAIYGHADNAEFRKLRPNPNLIYPGDILVIPDPKQRKEQRPTGQTHQFVLKRLRTLLRVEVHDEDDKPLAGKRFTLVAGSSTIEGQTDGDGVLEASVDPTLQEVELSVFAEGDETGPRYVWEVKIGHLDPVEEVTGVQARLNNLGYYCGECDGKLGPLTETALRAFQDDQGLDPTGEADEPTRGKLIEVHQV